MSKLDNVQSPDIKQAASQLKQATKQAIDGLVERQTLADLLILAAVAEQHLLIIGPPGTGKSAVVRRIAHALGGRYFEYLLGRFTEPSELFGPVDLRKLREGTIETQTANMLPEAEFAFLDEVFLGSTAVLNSLLNLLNERVFRRGHTQLQCPLRVCVGSANALPNDESLAAFADRFLIHAFTQHVPDPLLEDLLAGGWQISKQKPTIMQNSGQLVHLDLLSKAAKQADLSSIRSALSHCVRLLRKADIHLSDRRIVTSQALIAASAVLTGRVNPTEADLWPLIYIIPKQAEQLSAQEILKELLATSENTTLVSATDNATQSSAAYATKIYEQAKVLFNQKPDSKQQELYRQWLLQLESIAREIDASFHQNNLPETLKQLRQKIITITEADDV